MLRPIASENLDLPQAVDVNFPDGRVCPIFCGAAPRLRQIKAGPDAAGTIPTSKQGFVMPRIVFGKLGAAANWHDAQTRAQRV